jgi:hypothetical protein
VSKKALGMLAKMASKDNKKPSKSQTPELTIMTLYPKKDAPTIKCGTCKGKGEYTQPTGLQALVLANQEKKHLIGTIKGLEAQFIPEMEKARRKLCRDKGQFYGSIRVNELATFVTKNQYVPANIDERESLIETVADFRKVSKEDAEKMVDKRFTIKTVIVIKDEDLLNDEKFLEGLQKLAGDKLETKMVMEPTEKFHEDSALDADEEKLMEVLVNNRFIKPYKPSVRVSGTGDDDGDDE